MPKPRWNLIRLLLARSGPAENVDDLLLLDRFRRGHDAGAFELLVRRHSDLVYGVCRRVAKHEQDAEDAFQATFLILAKSARSVKRNLHGWLHRTAYRAALRASDRKRRRSETSLMIDPPLPPSKDLSELRSVLDVEIDRLPDRLRLAVLYCYVEGHTAEEAAALMQVPAGTVYSRLSKAREILTDRLTRRGVTAPAATIALASTYTTAEAAPALIAQTSLLTPVAGSAAELITLEVLRMTAWNSTKMLAAALVLTAGVGTGIGLSQAGKPVEVRTAKADPPAAAPQKEPDDRSDNNLLAAKREAEDRDRKHVAMKKLTETHQMRLRELTEAREMRRLQSLSTMDPKVIEEAIMQIDKDLLGLEEQHAGLGPMLAEAEKRITVVRNQPPNEVTVRSWLTGSEALTAAHQQMDRAEVRMRDLELKVPGESAPLKKARDEYVAAVKRYEAVKADSQKEAEARVVAGNVADATAARDQLQRQSEELKLKTEFKQKRRLTLVDQYRQSARTTMEAAALDREIEQAQRLRDEIQRMLMMQEAGLTQEPSNAAMDRLRREVDELRGEVRRLKEKK